MRKVLNATSRKDKILLIGGRSGRTWIDRKVLDRINSIMLRVG